MSEEIVCPKCHSNQISAGQKGFNSTAAVVSNLAGNSILTSAGIGMLGSNKSIITCLKCGNKFQPGDGTIKHINESGEENFEKQIFVDKDKIAGRRIALVLFIILLIIIIAIVVFFNSLKSSSQSSYTAINDSTKNNSTKTEKKKSKKPDKKIDLEPTTNGTFFIGSKSFCSNEYEDDCLKVTITENGDVSFYDFTDGDTTSIKGHIVGNKVIDDNGKNLFIKYKTYHFYMKRNKKWVDFNELKEN